MNETPARIALRARVVFPVSSAPIDGGVVAIEHGRIAAVGRHHSADGPVLDLGDVALLPGLINPHAHLEFSELAEPLGVPGMRFPDWIEAVVTRRRGDANREGAELSSGRRHAAFRNGMRQCVRSGTTTVGNTTTWEVTERMLPGAGPRCCEFRELIGLSQDDVAKQLRIARDYLERLTVGGVVRGLSPHAPYSTAPELVRQVASLSRRKKVTIAMHVAESPEEIRLLSHGDGPFRDVLQKLGTWRAEMFSSARRPADYLEMLRAAHRCLVVHGNFLEPADWAFLGRYRERMSAVYCPRTHHYFRYPAYPLSRMLDAGVRVVLGTDGRASAPDLDSFREFQFAARRHGDVRPRDLLRMVTLDAAVALGQAERVGSLERGKLADLAVVRPGSHPTPRQDPCEALLDEGASVCGVYLGGKRQASGDESL